MKKINIVIQCTARRVKYRLWKLNATKSSAPFINYFFSESEIRQFIMPSFSSPINTNCYVIHERLKLSV